MCSRLIQLIRRHRIKSKVIAFHLIIVEIWQLLTQSMLSHYQSVSTIQTKISTARSLLASLESITPSLDTAFSQLLHVHRMSPAYAAAIAELARQNDFSGGFLQAAKDFASVLAKVRGKELKKRRAFSWDEIRRYLPGLGNGDHVPVVQVNGM
jgi:hypothetical protein